MRQGADTEFEWTDEAKELTARSSLAVEAVRRGHLTGEEALLSVILGKPDTPEYMEKIAERIEEIPFPEARPRTTRAPGIGPEGHRERARRRYHEDEEYRQKCIARWRARRQTPEYKARERERARRRREAAKAREES